MPLYEYVCHECHGGFEALVHRFGDAVACPSCASDRVEKQLSVFAVATAPAPSPGSCGAGACATDPGRGPGPCGGGACGLPS